MLIQQREERTEHRCPLEAGRTNGSGVCGRTVRENMRAKEEWLNPDWRERCGSREANVKLRSTDEWRLTGLLIAARGNQCNRADVVSPVRVIVNVSV